MTVTVIGRNSFIGRALRSLRPAWNYLGHDGIDGAVGASCVINCAFAPELRRGEYDGQQDIDRRIAEAVADDDTHYIMLSSRLVYGVGRDRAWSEDDEAAPHNFYARNKCRIEQALPGILGAGRVTVLRLSNICGVEPGRATFFGMAQDSLRREGRIKLDMHPATRRDFLPVMQAAAGIVLAAESPHAGVYNLGAGFGTGCGDIAQWLIEGYGDGEIVAPSAEFRDAFWLSMQKFGKDFPAWQGVTAPELRAHCVACGRAARTQLR